jgi:hypothetical protein
VVTFSKLLTILSQVPGEVGTEIRELQQKILTDVLEGNRYLIKDIITNADNREGTYTMSSNTIFSTPPETASDIKSHRRLVKRHSKLVVAAATSKEKYARQVVLRDNITQEEEYLKVTIDFDETWAYLAKKTRTIAHVWCS